MFFKGLLFAGLVVLARCEERFVEVRLVLLKTIDSASILILIFGFRMGVALMMEVEKSFLETLYRMI